MQRLIFTCALIALFACSIFAQVNTATVSGAVTDGSHAAVPGVKLQLRNDATDATLSAVSNGAGQYTFSFVPVGPYTITVKQSGFQDQVRRGLEAIGPAGAEHDVGTRLGQALGEGDAEPGGRAGHDRHATVESEEVEGGHGRIVGVLPGPTRVQPWRS